MCRTGRRVLAVVAAGVFVFAGVAGAQNVATIAGAVKDPQGLAIPGATVVLSNRVSRTTQSATTDDSGRYTLTNVPYGTYVLAVTLSGFVPVEEVVEVRSSVPLARDVELSIGGVTETVNVSSDALLETSSTGSHVDLGANLIDQLPSATPSKQLSAMLLSAPGFIRSQNGRIHVRGSHGQIQYVVDGVPMTDEYSEAFANPIDPRYVKSAEVMTGGIPAEFGGKLAAVVDITSKSGLDETRPVTGAASLNFGTFGAVDGGVSFGGRITSRIGYFLNASANRTDRYLDPPTADNFHNAGDAQRFTGKLELRPTDADFVRAVVSVNGSDFQVANRLAGELAGVRSSQTLEDNSQTVTWMRQVGTRLALNGVGYRRAATAALDAANAVPLAATQRRSLDHQGVNAAASYSAGMHRLKAGVQYDRSPVSEEFRMVGNGDPDDEQSARFDPARGGTPFAFAGSRVGHTLGLFVQDTISPVDDLHISLGLRYDRYRLLIRDSAVSPRLGVAYHLHGTGTVVRGSYSRIFMPPFSENLLLSSSPEARALSATGESGEDVQPERQHAYEVGVQQALGTRAKLDLAYYRKDVRNLADVDQFLDTTVTFPLSVAKGVAQGIEGRLDVPVYRRVNGYLSVARATVRLTAPLTGGLFLGEVPAAGEEFYADHDQRWQSQFGMSYEHPGRRVFASVSGRYDTGIPFELPEDFDPATFEDPRALPLIDVDRERARPRAIADLVVGSQVLRRGNTRVELQGGIINVFNTTYLLNFLSIFNGTHYGPPRVWTGRVKVTF